MAGDGNKIPETVDEILRLFDGLTLPAPPEPERPPNKPDDFEATLRRMKERWWEKRRNRKRDGNFNASLRKDALEIGEIVPGVEYWITHNGMWYEEQRIQARKIKLPPILSRYMKSAEGLNGYIAFLKQRPPLKLNRFDVGDGIATYIPVHGGITYTEADRLGCVYGFDTMHFDSEAVPRTDHKWIRWQCRVLYEGLLKASALEEAYNLAAGDNSARAEICQQLIGMIPEQGFNFGTIIKMLGGEL